METFENLIKMDYTICLDVQLIGWIKLQKKIEKLFVACFFLDIPLFCRLMNNNNFIA
jgi:hypothetical protein